MGGSMQDKLRLFIIYLLGANAKPEIVEQCRGALEAQGFDMGAVKHAEEVRKTLGGSQHRVSTTTAAAVDSKKGGFFGSLASTGLDGLSKMAQASIKKVASLTKKTTDGTLCQIIDALVSNQ